MTDALAALACFANAHVDEREERLAWFENKWKDDPLVLDKWFALQATSRLPDTLERVRGLVRHRRFDIRNPNRVRALIGSFCHFNQRRFHDASGAGYRFLSEHVLAIDTFNSQSRGPVAGRRKPLAAARRESRSSAASGARADCGCTEAVEGLLRSRDEVSRVNGGRHHGPGRHDTCGSSRSAGYARARGASVGRGCARTGREEPERGILP